MVSFAGAGPTVKRKPTPLQGEGDGARRIRTADLLGAIRGGGQGGFDEKWSICREFQFILRSLAGFSRQNLRG
jgi:hypothetical protein